MLLSNEIRREPILRPDDAAYTFQLLADGDTLAADTEDELMRVLIPLYPSDAADTVEGLSAKWRARSRWARDLAWIVQVEQRRLAEQQNPRVIAQLSRRERIAVGRDWHRRPPEIDEWHADVTLVFAASEYAVWGHLPRGRVMIIDDPGSALDLVRSLEPLLDFEVIEWGSDVGGPEYGRPSNPKEASDRA